MAMMRREAGIILSLAEASKQAKFVFVCVRESVYVHGMCTRVSFIIMKASDKCQSCLEDKNQTVATITIIATVTSEV